jgi:hypothetical protein
LPDFAEPSAGKEPSAGQEPSADREPATPESRTPALVRQWVVTVFIALSIAASWTGSLERTAQTQLQSTLERALLTAALARGLNGVISVAQGTEIAIQPIGIGVTLTVGEILDPLNDLIERFSWLALAAAASLGTQMLLSDIFANDAVNAVLTMAGVIYLLAIWLPMSVPGRQWLLRATALLIFVRFIFTAVILMVTAVDYWLLEERQQVALSELTQTTQEIDLLQNTADSSAAATTPDSLLQRFESVIDSSRQAFDIEAQLNALKTKVESSVAELINLMAVFLVQTLVLPIGSLMLAFWTFRWFLSWLMSNEAYSSTKE